MTQENEIWEQFRSSTEMRHKMQIKQEVDEGNKKRCGKPQNNVANVRPTQPALKNNVTNVRLAQHALKNNVTNVRPISNIFNLLAKQGQTSQSHTQFKKHIIINKSISPGQMSDSQPPNTTPNTQSKKHVMTDKSTSLGQMSDSQQPNTTPNTQSKKHVMTDKSTSPSQMSDSQPPNTTPNTQSKKHVMTDKSTSLSQMSDSQPPKTTPNTQAKKHVMSDKSTSPGQISDSQLHNAVTNTLSERHVVDYCKMMGDKVLDEDMEQVPDGDKDMEQVPDGDKDMEQQKYIISENGKKVVLRIINDAWRKHKHTIKKKYFDPFKNTKERLKTPPTCIPLDHFKVLINFWRLEKIQHAKNENNQEPTQLDIFIETRTTNGIALDNDTQTTIDHLKGLVDNDGKSHDEAFHEIFGKEKSGRVRCGRRTLTPTLLKKNQEMIAMAKMHAMEMASMKEDMEKKLEERDRDMERKLEETQNYFKSMLKSVLTQMNPSLDVNAIDAMMPPTPRDANSGFNSSTTMHILSNDCCMILVTHLI
ncbi:hypothetical protein ACFE04_019551 [Oxalis oulophora]